MKFFKPEDFDIEYKEDTLISHKEWAANLANAKLEREGKVVYNHHGPSTNFNEHPVWISKGWQDGDSTHKALLICIEPIEQCKHPKEKVSLHCEKYLNGLPMSSEYVCQCGATVVADTFKEVRE